MLFKWEVVFINFHIVPLELNKKCDDCNSCHHVSDDSFKCAHYRISANMFSFSAEKINSMVHFCGFETFFVI